MRRYALLFAILSTACATTDGGPMPDTAPPHAVAAEPTSPAPPSDEPVSVEDDSHEARDEEAATSPRFELLGSRIDAGALRISAKLYDAHVPATFHLISDFGCSREARIPTTTIGIASSTALGADDLAVALGCAIAVDVGDELSATVVIKPDARTVASTGGLTLDSELALVAAELDPSSGDRIRFSVRSPDAFASATVTLGTTKYAARLASDEADDTAIFEVPARAWAEAVVTGTHAIVDAHLQKGAYASMVVAPYAAADMMNDEE